MKLTQKVNKEVEETIGYLCDGCKVEFENENTIASLSYYPGYGSEFDGDVWVAHLCEKCWIKSMNFLTGQVPTPGKECPYLLFSGENI